MFDSINEAKKTITVLKHALERKGEHTDPEVFGIISALQQMFDIAAAADQQDQRLTPSEITKIGEQGLRLIDTLVYKLASQDLELHVQDIEQVALVIAQWIIAHHGQLTNIQSVVDGLAYLANALRDKAALSELATFMGQVAQACNDVIKRDLDNSNPSRPWRILNINRGIVVTRSHNLEQMNSVFIDLIQAIPMDAPRFFQEGMSEMVKLNYPEQVRELMQEFYEQTKLPAVH